MNHKLIIGDTLKVLKSFANESVNTIITSPPYWGLRDYGIDGQIGLEPTLEEYINKVLAITKELKRVLRKDGVMFWNHGDCYGGSCQGGGDTGLSKERHREELLTYTDKPQKNYMPKCMVLQHYRLALKMIDDGWILRNIIIWNKPNHMPSSVKDRFTNSYEPVFMFVKNKKYYFDLDAVRKPHAESTKTRLNQDIQNQYKISKANDYYENIPISGGGSRKEIPEILKQMKDNLNPLGKNPRDVWTIPTQPFPEAHFAVFPEKLVEPMIKAGCPREICSKCGKARERIVESLGTGVSYSNDNYERQIPDRTVRHQKKKLCAKKEYKGWTKCDCNEKFIPGTVLDPFVGAGTTMVVAEKNGVNSIGTELNPNYAKIIEKRMKPFLGQMKLNGQKTTLEVIPWKT